MLSSPSDVSNGHVGVLERVLIYNALGNTTLYKHFILKKINDVNSIYIRQMVKKYDVVGMSDQRATIKKSCS